MSTTYSAHFLFGLFQLSLKDSFGNALLNMVYSSGNANAFVGKWENCQNEFQIKIVVVLSLSDTFVPKLRLSNIDSQLSAFSLSALILYFFIVDISQLYVLKERQTILHFPYQFNRTFRIS